jgi:hypothetical protein
MLVANQGNFNAESRHQFLAQLIRQYEIELNLKIKNPNSLFTSNDQLNSFFQWTAISLGALIFPNNPVNV